MERLLNVLTVFSLVLVGFVLVSLRRAHIRVEYSMSWLAAGVVLLALSRSHEFLDAMARGGLARVDIAGAVRVCDMQVVEATWQLAAAVAE